MFQQGAKAWNCLDIYIFKHYAIKSDHTDDIFIFHNHEQELECPLSNDCFQYSHDLAIYIQCFVTCTSNYN